MVIVLDLSRGSLDTNHHWDYGIHWLTLGQFFSLSAQLLQCDVAGKNYEISGEM